MPEFTIVASWRVAMTSSSALTRLKRAMMSPALAGTSSSMSTTIRPFERSCAATACLSPASISPLLGIPERSSALNAKLAMVLSRLDDAHQATELVGATRARLGELARDLVLAHQLDERGVHRLHAVLCARLQRRVDLVRLALADQVADSRSRHEHLGGDRAALAVRRRQELLRDDALQGHRKLHAHLLLLLGREHVHDAVHGLSGVLRVERREDEVAGLGRGQRGRDRLEVSHLADEAHVGVLTERGLQAESEALRIGAQLALVDDALLVLVQELDRVLDREDVFVPGVVDQVEHRGERRRLARAGRARDEH